MEDHKGLPMINRFLKKMQIKDKLIILNLLIAGIVFLFAAVILLITEYISFKDSLLHDLTIQAKIVAGNSSASLAFNDQKTAGETLAALKTSPNIECALIYARNGAVFATYWRQDMENKIPPVPPPKDGHSFDNKRLSVVHGIALDRERIGTIYIRSDLNRLHFLMIRNGIVALFTLLFVFIVAYALLSKWHGVIIEPIMNLFQVMKLVSWEKNYTLQAHVYSEDEIGSLAQGFNDMLEQIRERDAKLLAEIAERIKAEESVQRMNEELERKVEERTKQLMDAQEELVRNEKLAILGQLSGSVGHELRNPLGVMNNAVYFLKTVMSGGEETVMEYLDIIKHEIDNSERIITDLLDFARTKPPRKMAVMVGGLVGESLARCAIPDNVDIRSDIPDKLPPLNVDPLQMQQVFQNLISNAIQSMPEGGLLCIIARLVSSSEFEFRRCEPEAGRPYTGNRN